ncbi:MAG: type II toxin-antitoxin system VapC family toxin [Candidatus Krumholzibacteriota bacterium]|nr:type II toxin-antitoxin system VapC family toxin [Candidatus Krumholzibacteriota bacterium]
MNVVDSSGWLEFFADGPNADFFTSAIQDTEKLILPTLSIFEVFKKILQQREEGEALQAIALMQQGAVVELTSSLALEAARLSIEEKLPLADSVMLTTSRAYEATLWTQDSDFEGMSGVKYVKKI